MDANEGWGELIERIYHSSKSREPKSADVQSDEIEHPQWRLRQAILYAAEALADASSKDEQGNAAGNLDFVLRLWQAGLSDEGKRAHSLFGLELREAKAVAFSVSSASNRGGSTGDVL